MPDLLEIDGSYGEGGGQILRTSLTLSLATGRPIRIYDIRGGRKKPGLLNQHLTCVKAAAEIGRAETRGDVLHSRDLTFAPTAIVSDEYEFRVKTAGSATLVLQTVLPALLLAEGPSSLALEGGTHNPHAPPFEFLARSFLPLVERLGPTIKAKLDRPGFYPAGGGRFRVSIDPPRKWKPLDLLGRGRKIDIRATAVVSNLPRHIAERELKIIARRLSLGAKQLDVLTETRAQGPGNVVMIEIESEHVTECFTGFGERGVSAERVATRAAKEAKAYLESEAAVGELLADQLLVPLALGAGGRFRTTEPSLHFTTNADVIQRFLDVSICAEQVTDEVWRVDITKGERPA